MRSVGNLSCLTTVLEKNCPILVLFCHLLSVLVVTRFFKQYLLMLAINQMAASLFRFIGGAARNMIVANVFASFMLLIFMVLGGFILVRGNILTLMAGLIAIRILVFFNI